MFVLLVCLQGWRARSTSLGGVHDTQIVVSEEFFHGTVQAPQQETSYQEIEAQILFNPINPLEKLSAIFGPIVIPRYYIEETSIFG